MVQVTAREGDRIPDHSCAWAAIGVTMIRRATSQATRPMTAPPTVRPVGLLSVCIAEVSKVFSLHPSNRVRPSAHARRFRTDAADTDDQGGGLRQIYDSGVHGIGCPFVVQLAPDPVWPKDGKINVQSIEDQQAYFFTTKALNYSQPLDINKFIDYGPLDRFKSVLKSSGFREQEFWFPSPHAHSYAAENDAEEERLMAEVEWKYSPLRPGDEWD